MDESEQGQIEQVQSGIGIATPDCRQCGTELDSLGSGTMYGMFPYHCHLCHALTLWRADELLSED